MKRILIAEDEIEIRDILFEYFTENKFVVDVVSNGKEALNAIEHTYYNLIITDIMMPELDGKEFIAAIRKKDNYTPVIVITALSEDGDEIEVMDLGADGYIKKPFSLRVLLSHCESLLRKKNSQNSYSFLDYELNIDDLTLKHKDELVILTEKEIKILIYLFDNSDRIISRDELTKNIWGFNYSIGELRNIDAHIKNIRKKTYFEIIQTINGIGYKIK